MAAYSEAARKGRGFRVASRRFPNAEFAIRKLMNRDEAFCDMCDELADAELALANVSAVPVETRNERAIEWQEVVDRLIVEIGNALRENEAWAKLDVR